MPVVTIRGTVVSAAEFDAGDVFQPRHAAVTTYLDNHVTELGGSRESALRVQRILESSALLGQRRTADNSRRHLDVLLLDSVDHVARGNTARRQLVGIEPQPH